jgi:uncharacterized protein (DUF58 family)
MALSIAALNRTKDIRHAGVTPPDTSAGAYASAEYLAGLKHAARDFSFLPRQPIHSLLSGRHGSRVRGRGLAFEELRQYIPGDDIRTMDWRVTARAGKPFVRVYDEEKDHPALFIVDQRINMFFGTRRAMKSVAAAEVAALGAWRVLAQDDRVGGFVFNDEKIDEVRPHRSSAAVMRFIETIAAQNTALRADSPVQRNQSQLDAVLDAAAKVADHDHLVVIASDFDGHGPRTRDLLIRLATHNDVLAVLVYDPFLLELPNALELVVSDGELQVELRRGAQKSILDYAHGYGKTILSWQREIGVPVLPLSAAEETAAQIRRLLGQEAVAQRRR